MAEPVVAVGGVSGSGTRLVAAVLRDAGVYIGADLNEALDNLWFTLLLKRPRWLPDRLWADDPEILHALEVFQRAMEGLAPRKKQDLGYVQEATRDLQDYGHNNRGDGRGQWALDRLRSLMRAAERRPPTDRWGWKEPCTMLLLHQIQRRFPDIRYVHVMRHGVDMAFRADQQDLHTWGRLLDMEPPYEEGPVEPLRYWLTANERALEHAEMLPEGNFLLVRYEELCARPHEGIERLLGFLGVEGGDVDRLATLATPSPWIGIHSRQDLSVFESDDIERVRALGFEAEGVSRPVVARRADGAARDGLRLSIAMTTYQGEGFLPEQLESIALQSRPPDELVICDDRSSDRSVDLLEHFRTSVSFPVRIKVNERNLGSTKNYEQAIGLCQGDVILLADQDDIWVRRKVERLVGVLAASPEAAGVFSNADLIDERSRPIGRGLWQTLGFEGDFRRRFASGHAFELLTKANVVTGATMAFRSSFRDLLLPIPSNWVQDAWIAILLSAVSRLVVLPERLIRYRLHQGQQIGVPDPDSTSPEVHLTRAQHMVRWTQFRRRMRKNERELMRGMGEYFGPVVERLRACEHQYAPPADVFPLLVDTVRHWQARGRMELEPNRMRLVLQELRRGRYHRYSNGVSSAAKDLLLLDRSARRRE